MLKVLLTYEYNCNRTFGGHILWSCSIPLDKLTERKRCICIKLKYQFWTTRRLKSVQKIKKKHIVLKIKRMSHSVGTAFHNAWMMTFLVINFLTFYSYARVKMSSIVSTGNFPPAKIICQFAHLWLKRTFFI